MKEAENLPALPVPLDHRTKHEVRQALIFGASLHDVAQEQSIPLEVVTDFVRREMGNELGPQGRKAVALARIDELGAMLVARGSDGDLDAINTWIKLQKREATLAGLDEPERQERRVVVEAPWLTARRLKYKDSAVLAEDIASRSTIIPPPKSED